MTSAEWAAWVQAAGTIIALAIAIAAPLIHERIRDRSDRRKLLTAIAAVVTELASRLENVVETCSTSKGATDYVRNFEVSGWNHVYRALNAFPLHSTSEYQLAFAVLEVQSLLQAIEECIQDAQKGLLSDFVGQFQTMSQIKPMVALIRKHSDALHEALKLKTPWWRPLPPLKDVW